VTLAAVLVLVGALTALAVFRPGPIGDWWAGSAKPSVAPDPVPTAPVLAGPATTAPVPTPEGVRAALDDLVAVPALGPRVHVSVLDVVTGQQLYERGPDELTIPASTTKLVTAVAVLAALGPAQRIPTRVVAGNEPGEVVLVGGGDPTLAVDDKGYYAGAGRLDKLAEQVRTALGGTAPSRVTIDGTLFSGPVFGPGWDDDIPTSGYVSAITALMTDGARRNPRDPAMDAARFPEPDLAAGRSFAKLLGVPESAVRKGAAPPPPAAPGPTTDVSMAAGSVAFAPGTELGRVESPPMIRLVDYLLIESDNVVGEALARQVALARERPASFAGAAEAMKIVLAELGLPAAELDLADGSGLSRDNRISPSLLTDLLAMAARGDRPELTGLFNGLPVAGWSGTLAGRFSEPEEERRRGTRAALGTVRAKTGTLNGVHALSGVVTTADNRLLAFAVLTDRVPGWTAQPELDRIVAALARCGCG
jgi:D-alanyl-D-alanine carboxypeptidase/D-alanyl-D-alanine-endopeptidase (penicillin-binding protein 4)